MKITDISTGVDIYPVGLLADLKHFRGWWRNAGRRRAIRHLISQIRRGWKRRSYWNGYLAEADGVARCGHGWTRRRARLSLERAYATRHWAKHSCGTIRLASDETEYCATCDVKSRKGWTKVADYVPAASGVAGQTRQDQP